MVPPIAKVMLHPPRVQRAGKTLYPADASLVYVSLTSPASGSDQIDVFDQRKIKGLPIAIITEGLDGAEGLWVDQQRSLWVANAGGFILEFPLGHTKPSRRIDVPAKNGYPVNLWIAGDGTIYAITWGSSGSVISKRTPAGQWSIVGEPNMTAETGIVGDTSGDLFAAGFTQVINGGTVEWLPAGSSQWQSLGFPYILEPGGVAFDFLGRLAIADGEVGDIFSYDWIYGQLQDAFRCYNCSNAIAFNTSGKRAWTVTGTNPATLENFQFPGGRRFDSVTFALNTNANGMALSPPFSPPAQQRR